MWASSFATRSQSRPHSCLPLPHGNIHIALFHGNVWRGALFSVGVHPLASTFTRQYSMGSDVLYGKVLMLSAIPIELTPSRIEGGTSEKFSKCDLQHTPSITTTPPNSLHPIQRRCTCQYLLLQHRSAFAWACFAPALTSHQFFVLPQC